MVRRYYGYVLFTRLCAQLNALPNLIANAGLCYRLIFIDIFFHRHHQYSC